MKSPATEAGDFSLKATGKGGFSDFGCDVAVCLAGVDAIQIRCGQPMVYDGYSGCGDVVSRRLSTGSVR